MPLHTLSDKQVLTHPIPKQMSKCRSDLTNSQWQTIAHLFPNSKGPGRPLRSIRLIVNGILWYHYNRSVWRDLPQRFGPWQTVHSHYNQWSKDGRLDKLLSILDAPEISLSKTLS
jgi:transposase